MRRIYFMLSLLTLSLPFDSISFWIEKTAKKTRIWVKVKVLPQIEWKLNQLEIKQVNAITSDVVDSHPNNAGIESIGSQLKRHLKCKTNSHQFVKMHSFYVRFGIRATNRSNSDPNGANRCRRASGESSEPSQ